MSLADLGFFIFLKDFFYYMYYKFCRRFLNTCSRESIREKISEENLDFMKTVNLKIKSIAFFYINLYVLLKIDFS